MLNFRKYHFIILSLISGLLLSMAWSDLGIGPVLFIGFLPLLIIEDFLSKNKRNFGSISAFYYSLPAFLLFSILISWGAATISIYGLISIVLLTGIFMATVFWLFHVVKRNLGSGFGYFSLIAFWLAFEYFFQEGEINCPLLNLGNGFARNISLIQWYEYTGLYGGTFWALMMNVLLFQILKSFVDNTRTKLFGQIVIASFVLTFPIVSSLFIYHNYEEKQNPYNIVIIQPNADPYSEKYNSKYYDKMIDDIIELAGQKTNISTDFILAPETSIPTEIWLDSINSNSYIQRINKFITGFPKVRFMAGLHTRKLYSDKESSTKTAHVYDSTGRYFDYYNSALQCMSDESIQIYHKSKLVMGSETMPYVEWLSFMEDFIVDMGGYVGSAGTQKERTVFSSEKDTIKVAPVICYESVFGDYVGEYIKKGANLIFIMTDDGWWGRSSVHKYHLSYASLRAIESRRSIARSANTGISCFINQKGEILQPTKWWTQDAIAGTINANDTITFYTKNGDFISRIAIFFSGIILLYLFVKIVIRK